MGYKARPKTPLTARHPAIQALDHLKQRDAVRVQIQHERLDQEFRAASGREATQRANALARQRRREQDAQKHQDALDALDTAECPQECPRCAGRLEADDQGNWWCRGLKTREEVERYLAPLFPRGIVPESIDSKPPCGWVGKSADWGVLWL